MTEPQGVTTTPFKKKDMELLESPTVGKLVTALIAAELEFDSVAKDEVNPHFNSKFSSLKSIHKATKQQLLRNGVLTIGQTGWDTESGKNWVFIRLIHTSGEWLGGRWLMTPTKKDPQGEGSALTYARRQIQGALLDIAAEMDDDGNAASTPAARPAARQQAAQPAEPAKAPSGRKWLAEAEAICKKKDKPEARRAQLLALMEECRDGFGELTAELLGKFVSLGNGLKAEIEAAAASSAA